MAAVEANASRLVVGTNGWSGMLTDAIVKCGRNSERRLYMYGISSTRCPKCQARLRPDLRACIMCHYEHKTLRNCMRCSKNNNPVMWCAECDAYFCAQCHKKPHVLMLGSSKPHHCFAIDSASGKHLVEAAWSNEFITMARTTYRLRRQEKMQIDEAKAVVTGQQIATSVEGVDCATVPAADVLLTAGSLATFTDEREALNVSLAVSTTDISAAGTTKLTRKRQFPSLEDGRGKKSARAEESSQKSGNSMASFMDGMSLYDRVKAMHDSRAKAVQANALDARLLKETLSKSLSQQIEEHVQQNQTVQTMREEGSILQQQPKQHRQQEAMQIEPFKKNQERLEQEEANQQQNKLQLQPSEARRQVETQRQQNERRQQDNERQQEECRQLEKLHRREDLHRQDNFQEEQRHRSSIDYQVCHEQTMREQDARRQAAAQSLVLDESSYVSQTQHIFHSQPGFAAASMANLNIPAPVLQGSNDRFTQISSPLNIPSHTPRFQPIISSPAVQDHSCDSTNNTNVSTSIGNKNGFQDHQRQPRTPAANVRDSLPVSSLETYLKDHDGNHHLVVRNCNAQQQYQPPDFSDTIVLHRTIAGAGDERFEPSRACENDELRAIWVSDYDSVNALVMQLDSEIIKRTEEGHEFVHRSNNITIPEQLTMQINSLRAQRDAAIKKRFESLVRVLIFSEAVRSFAHQNEHVDIWSDVPAVLKSSHKKCAELAVDIHKLEGQAQKLREGIDKAVSSGNPSQMQNVAQLGALIADLERRIWAANGERDKQFIFMFQFSGTLRDIVRNEWAASGSGYLLSVCK